MITLRLFRAAEPFHEIETRVVGEGEIAIGRDPSADWRLDDDTAQLSRRHCVISVAGAGVRLRDTSANGVYLGPERRRIDRDAEVAIEPGEAIHLGPYVIVADAAQARPANQNEAPSAFAAPSEPAIGASIFQDAPPEPAAFAVRADWPVEERVPTPANAAPLTKAALLEAFCEGAGLDHSVFAGHDPVEVMRRAGAVYRQMVLGVGELMAERTSFKAELRLDRTTIDAAGNNPFKWAPTQRVAIDILCGRNDNFLTGAAALRASFEDLKKHLLCLLAGSRAAVDAAFESLSPAEIEAAAKPQPRLLANRNKAAWRTFVQRHAEFSGEARAGGDSRINRAFKAGYERHLLELDRMSSPW